MTIIVQIILLLSVETEFNKDAYFVTFKHFVNSSLKTIYPARRKIAVCHTIILIQKNPDKM